MIGVLENGSDFFNTFSRAEFEEISADLFAQVTKPIREILVETDFTIDDIDHIELIGGGIRIPRIQAILSKFFSGKPLGFHLNGDESIALGASILA